MMNFRFNTKVLFSLFVLFLVAFISLPSYAQKKAAAPETKTEEVKAKKTDAKAEKTPDTQTEKKSDGKTEKAPDDKVEKKSAAKAEKIPNTQAEKKLSQIPLDFGIFINMGSVIQINQAPLPSGSMTLFTFGIGGRINFAKWFSFMPHFTFFGNYYLWAYDNALPSPPENRTAYVPAFILDLPICFVVPVKESQFSFGIGLALYARAGFLTNGVPSSFQEDVEKINKYFWSNAHFIMPSFHLAWDFNLPGDTRAGIFAKYFFPIGTFVDPNAYSPAQEHLVTVGVRFTFNLKPKAKEAKAEKKEKTQ